MPLTIPTFTPAPVVSTTGVRRSRRVRNVPTWATPAASSRSAVRTSPSYPWSTAWFDAVVHASQPIEPIQPAMAGGAAKTG